MKTYQCTAYFIRGDQVESITYYQQADTNRLAEIGFDFFLDWYMLDPDTTQVVDVPLELLPCNWSGQVC